MDQGQDLQDLFWRRMSAYIATFVPRVETRPTGEDINGILLTVLQGQSRLIGRRRGVQMEFGVSDITQMIYDAIYNIYGPWVIEDSPVRPINPMHHFVANPEDTAVAPDSGSETETDSEPETA